MYRFYDDSAIRYTHLRAMRIALELTQTFEATSMKLLEDVDLLNPNIVDRSADDTLEHMEALSRVAYTLGETRQGIDPQIPLKKNK